MGIESNATDYLQKLRGNLAKNLSQARTPRNVSAKSNKFYRLLLPEV